MSSKARAARLARNERRKAVCAHSYEPEKTIVNGQVTWTEYDVEVFPSLNALRDRFGRVTRHRPRPKNPEAPKLWGGIRMEVTGEGETRWFLKVHPVGMKCGVVNVYW